ncbi:MAG: rod-binding protein [Candidatus Eremiobacteraeota bacterium]|nr:rod-binding protein [Candidatus Eremiobacteraeota bacterium]
MAGDINGVGKNAQSQQLTPDQQQALKRLHEAATQFEGVFMEMVMNAMQDTVPKESIFGQNSSSEEMWQGMLNDERAQAMAQNGGLGIGKVLEEQMRSQVLSDAHQEAHVDVKGRTEP